MADNLGKTVQATHSFAILKIEINSQLTSINAIFCGNYEHPQIVCKCPVAISTVACEWEAAQRPLSPAPTSSHHTSVGAFAESGLKLSKIKLPTTGYFRSVIKLVDNAASKEVED